MTDIPSLIEDLHRANPEIRERAKDELIRRIDQDEELDTTVLELTFRDKQKFESVRQACADVFMYGHLQRADAQSLGAWLQLQQGDIQHLVRNALSNMLDRIQYRIEKGEPGEKFERILLHLVHGWKFLLSSCKRTDISPIAELLVNLYLDQGDAQKMENLLPPNKWRAEYTSDTNSATLDAILDRLLDGKPITAALPAVHRLLEDMAGSRYPYTRSNPVAATICHILIRSSAYTGNWETIAKLLEHENTGIADLARIYLANLADSRLEKIPAWGSLQNLDAFERQTETHFLAWRKHRNERTATVIAIELAVGQIADAVAQRKAALARSHDGELLSGETIPKSAFGKKGVYQTLRGRNIHG